MLHLTRGLAAAFVVLALPASALAQTPQAPVFPIIAQSETLPFTLEGGGEIEIAVNDGPFTRADRLALAPYAGQDVRVRARKVGATDTFDATYTVRETYPPGDALGTPANPDVSVIGSSPLYRGWATGYRDYLPGPNVANNWKTPENAVGAVGGTGYEGNTSVVVIGDRGQLTMTFGSPIRDDAGPDFAVFENGFRVGTSKIDFVELGYVEVSSNGTDFVRFDSASNHATTVGGFAGAPASAFGGLAGRDLNGKGTPFDLTSLRNKPQVRSGQVDLMNITAVKIVDIKGDGNDKDSFGRPIYDPDPTAQSGGFDLRGIGVFHQRDAGITNTRVAFTGPGSATLATSVSPGTRGAQDVKLELAHGDSVQVIGSGTVAADAAFKEFSYDVNGLFSGATYRYRVTAEAPDGTVVAGPWREFVKTAATVANPPAPALVREGAGVKATVRTAVNPQTDGELSIRAEWGTPDGPTTLTDPVKVTTATTPQIPISGLAQKGAYRFRFIATRLNGTKLVTDWVTFNATVARTFVADSFPPLLTDTEAEIGIGVRPGTTTDQKIVLQWSTVSNFATFTQTEPQIAPLASPETRLTFKLAGLSVRTYYFRFMSVEADGSLVVGSTTRNFTPPGNRPQVLNTSVEAVTPGAARVTALISQGSWGGQTVRAEYSTVEDGSGAVRTDATATTQNATVKFDLRGLAPARDYWVRYVTTSANGFVATGDWVKFTSAALTPALGATRATQVGTTTATVDVAFDPSGFDRFVAVEYGLEGEEATLRTAPRGSLALDPAATVAFALTDLEPGRTYRFRAVGTSAGAPETTEWATFTTESLPVVPTPTPTPTATPVVVAATPTATPTPTPTVAKAKLDKARVRVGARQRLTVSGLRAGERVVVMYRGERISAAAAKAAPNGTFALRFAVGRSPGVKTVTVLGTASGALQRITFRVTR